MKSWWERNKDTYLTIIFCLLSILFTLSLFKNISYPLFWADESMTVMHGKRVLEYGYPKVHDGKNVLYDLRHPNPTLGIDEKTDAFIGGANWGQYYIAAIGVKLAEMSDDIFTRTAIIRTTFALVGLTGLAIFAFLATHFFYSKPAKTVFLILFAFLELISVPLVLHLREARYYSLSVFFIATTVFIHAQYRLMKKFSYRKYFMLLIISLFLLFVTFSPAYFISLAALFFYELTSFVKQLFFSGPGKMQADDHTLFPRERLFKRYIRDALPLLISLVTVYPLIVFFDMFHISEEMSKFYASVFHNAPLDMYKNNLAFTWRYFASFDSIYLAIFLKVSLLSCFLLTFLKKDLSPFDMPKVIFSVFLTLFFVVYCLAIAKIPNLLFTRYIIPLQPVLTLIIIFDLAIIYNFVSGNQAFFKSYVRSSLVVIFFGLIFYNISNNVDYIKGHIYELSHQYRGPLDFVIPFIKDKYVDTGRLVIATNYEETSFMYYLDSKVIIGFVGNNLDEDSRAIPDVIVYRQGVSRNFVDLFSEFFNRGQYNRILFPVVDRPPNNIPELNWDPPLAHRFRTEMTDDDRAKVEFFLRM